MLEGKWLLGLLSLVPVEGILVKRGGPSVEKLFAFCWNFITLFRYKLKASILILRLLSHSLVLFIIIVRLLPHIELTDDLLICLLFYPCLKIAHNILVVQTA